MSSFSSVANQSLDVKLAEPIAPPLITKLKFNQLRVAYWKKDVYNKKYLQIQSQQKHTESNLHHKSLTLLELPMVLFAYDTAAPSS